MMDEESKSEEIMGRLEERWEAAASEGSASGEGIGDDGDGFGALNREHERVAHRIQEQQLAMGPIGRGSSFSSSSNDDDNTDDIDSPLSQREYQALKTYAHKEHSIHPKDFARLTSNNNDPDLIPHHHHQSISSGSEGNTPSTKFDADLDLAYLNPKLNRMAFSTQGNENQYDDPFADLLPSDLNPARKVNRRHAKPLPKKILHHNNLILLRRYVTPGGKIMNRVQSRLGAKDQRKVAKLVKRARHLGLIPHMGQWKLEDHGYLHEKGLDAEEGKREWEKELEERGLWPLADDTDVFKKFYDVDGLIDHLGGGGKKREELESLLSTGTIEWKRQQEGKKKKKKKNEEGESA
jgi:ribosomal protein S18